jgi:HAD superfamily hydrolase (TIGR01490 family)
MRDFSTVGGSRMKLAIFDLDNTLLGGDSDHAWGEYLIQAGLVDATEHKARNDQFYYQYQHGGLDIHEYVAFTIKPIMRFDEAELLRMHREFMQDFIQPMLLQKSTDLLASHKERGDYTVIVTATNEFITRPIAELLGVDKLLATELERIGGRFTGKVSGIPSFQGGKVRRLLQWLKQEQDAAPDSHFAKLSLENSIFYSDSFNDLPLLEIATEAVAVDPDPVLEQTARERGWPVISLRY